MHRRITKRSERQRSRGWPLRTPLGLRTVQITFHWLNPREVGVQVQSDDEIQSIAGMDPNKLAELQNGCCNRTKGTLRRWSFVMGWLRLQVVRGNSATTDTRRVARFPRRLRDRFGDCFRA